MARRCSYCGGAHSWDHCTERLEAYHGTASDYTEDEDDEDDEDDIECGSYGVPLGLIDTLEDADQRLCWRPDADLRVVLADLRGEFLEEWMLASAQEGAFSSGREIRADGGRSGNLVEVFRRETIQRCDCGGLSIGDCDCEVTR